LKGSGETRAQITAAAAEQSGIKTVGIYAGALGFGYNPELGSRRR